MKPGIHISDPTNFEDDGDDDYAAQRANVGELRSEISKHKARREAAARKPRSFAEFDTAEVYRKFNSAKPKTANSDDND